ncbi:MAG: hypothetical protein R3B89_25765 [Polyangiaceae bacterium]
MEASDWVSWVMRPKRSFAKPSAVARRGVTWGSAFTVGSLLVAPLSGCDNTAKTSVTKATPHVSRLVQTATSDIHELERGLPRGARALGQELFPQEKQAESDAGADAGTSASRASALEDPQELKRLIEQVRAKDPDLRVAKSTFFAVADPSGKILRNDQQQDLMAGKSLFGGYPELKTALTSKEAFVRTKGSMPEASGIRGRDDAQLVLASPIRQAGKPDAEVKGLFVSGWSWTSYCYRLENALKGWHQDERGEENGKPGKMPVAYVFVVVGDRVYGAPEAPQVNIDTIAGLSLLSQTQGDSVFSKELEITGRAFGVVGQRVPALGDDVALAILRSET